MINGLLAKNKVNRYGFKGVNEIKSHPWFANFSWDDLLSGRMKAPYQPNNNIDNFDEAHCKKEDLFVESDVERLFEIQSNLRLY